LDSKTILVADDESHILAVVSLKLRNAGFTVLTASDGNEAFELAVKHRPDLLITDFHMPGLSGLELCQKLKASSSGMSMPAIMLTARGYRLEPADTAESGIVRMINKPFSPRQLLSAVQDVLEIKQAA
jgi:two-component system, OmpR family, alkaline phosphatase synthesis response regulator PhoP